MSDRSGGGLSFPRLHRKRPVQPARDQSKVQVRHVHGYEFLPNLPEYIRILVLAEFHADRLIATENPKHSDHPARFEVFLCVDLLTKFIWGVLCLARPGARELVFASARPRACLDHHLAGQAREVRTWEGDKGAYPARETAARLWAL